MADSFSSLDDRRGAIRYLQAIRQHWFLVASLTALALVCGAATALLSAPRYEATTDILIQPLDSGDTTFRGMSLFRQTLDGSSPVALAARVLGSPEIANTTFARLRDSGAHVSFKVEPLSQAAIVTVRATAPKAATAAEAANTYAQVAVDARTAVFQRELKALVARLQRRTAAIPSTQRYGNYEYATLQQQLGELQGFVGATDPTLGILTPAVLPTAPSWPRTKLTVAVALLVGLLVGSGVAVAIEVFNPRIMREQELTLGHRLPILARIPRLARRVTDAHLSGNGLLPGGAWKGYRTLRAVLATAGESGGYPKSILVTGATPGDGKTMTAVNLAITLASSNLRVILVDADAHRPTVSTVFQSVGRRDGVIQLLSGKAAATQVLVGARGVPRLQLLLSNPEQAAYLHLFETERFRRMLGMLSEHADVIVIDSPPLPEVAEVLAVADASESVIIAVRLGHTRREKLAEVRELLARRGISPLGFVVTLRDRRSTEPDSGYYQSGATTPELVGFPEPKPTPAEMLGTLER